MSHDDAESDWIQRAIAGDRTALSELLLVHYDSLAAQISARISRDLQGLVRSEDILQQTFVRVARSIHLFEQRDRGSFRSWLQTIATNLVKDAEKRRRRERRGRSTGPARTESDSSLVAMVDRIASQDTSPSGRVQRQENARRMRAALDRLPLDQREVIELYYLHGHPLAEIAAATGRSKDAVRGICFRARNNLRTLIGGSSLYFSG